MCPRKNLYESRHFNRKRLEECVAGPLKVRDTKITVIIRANERMTFTNYLDPQYEVFKIRGIVYWVKHQPYGRVRILNRLKLLLVDSNICWDEVHKRPTRDPRRGIRLDAALKRSIPAVPKNTEFMHRGGLLSLASLPIFPTSGSTAQLPASSG